MTRVIEEASWRKSDWASALQPAAFEPPGLLHTAGPGPSPAPQQWLCITMRCPWRSDVTGMALAKPTGLWARKPEGMTQNTGPTELGCQRGWATSSGAGGEQGWLVRWAFRGSRRTTLGLRKLEGLGGIKTDSLWGTWVMSLRGSSRPVWLSGEGRVGLKWEQVGGVSWAGRQGKKVLCRETNALGWATEV